MNLNHVLAIHALSAQLFSRLANQELWGGVFFFREKICFIHSFRWSVYFVSLL